MIRNIQPLKKFGQNYLVDKNILNKIVDEINPKENDFIIEIGPGLGSLTREIYSRTKNFTSVEIDTRVIENLKNEFSDLNLINADFLKLDLTEIYKNQKLRIVGNIPYNITSPILFKLIENRSFIYDAVLMVQLEVAKRITAEEMSDDYGILGVLLNFFAVTKLCFKISPYVFYPKPKVDSAIIHLNFNKHIPDDVDDKVIQTRGYRHAARARPSAHR